MTSLNNSTYDALNVYGNGLQIGRNNVDQSGDILGTVTNNLTNFTSGAVVSVVQDLKVPKGGLGYPIYNMQYLPISSPYQIACISDPADDQYVSQRIKPYFNFNDVIYNQIVNYTYVYYITGISVLYPSGVSSPPPVSDPLTSNVNTYVRAGDSVLNEEITIVNCPATSTCQSQNYPRAIVKNCGTLTFVLSLEISPAKQSTECVITPACTYSKKVQYIGTAAKIFNFVISRARELYSEGTDLIEFQSAMFAYLVVINCACSLFPTNPFLMSTDTTTNLSTQLTYPYMVQSSLIMQDAYYAVDDKWASLFDMAIKFVNVYGKIIWSEGVTTDNMNANFEYTYLQPLYFALNNQIIMKNTALWNCLNKK